MKNVIVRNYLKSIKMNLNCSSIKKKAFISYLTSEINCFDTEDITKEDLIEKFGTPTDVVSSFKNENIDYLNDRIKLCKQFLIVTIITIIVLLILFSLAIAIIIASNNNVDPVIYYRGK